MFLIPAKLTTFLIEYQKVRAKRRSLQRDKQHAHQVIWLMIRNGWKTAYAHVSEQNKLEIAKYLNKAGYSTRINDNYVEISVDGKFMT